jgi:hypothetical protein
MGVGAADGAAALEADNTEALGAGHGAGALSSDQDHSPHRYIQIILMK